MPVQKTRIFNLIMSFNREFGGRMRQNAGANPESVLRTATLLFVKKEEPSMKALASFLSIRPPSVTSLVGAMEKAKLLKRVQDPDDLRSFRLQLTEHGERALREKKKIMQACLGDMLKPLTLKEQNTLISILEKITTV